MKRTVCRFTVGDALPRLGGACFAYAAGVLTFVCFYDSHAEPLKLSAPAEAGDTATLAMLDVRLELYINGVLCDEEWFYGAPLFDMPEIGVAEEYSEPILPSVIGGFDNAEGWKPDEYINVGDCMPYADDRFHVIYLKDRHHHCSKWCTGAHEWEHISTADFRSWQIHPSAVRIDETWQGSVCTGSHIECDGVHYLFYTYRMYDYYSVPKDKRLPAPICRSISYDGYHYQRDKSFGFCLPDGYTAGTARDPKVIKGADGYYHMFITTTDKSKASGCLAHLVSHDLNSWETREPIYYTGSDKEPECPDWFEYCGHYYLVLSIAGRAKYLVSDEPFGNFREMQDPWIPCERVPKAAVWGGKIVFVGYRPYNVQGGYAGSMTFCTATADANGLLLFDK